MLDLATYLSPVLAQFKDKRVQKNILLLTSTITENHHLRLYSMAEDPKEYNVFKGLINGNQQNTLNAKTLLAVIQDQAVADLSGSIPTESLFVLHDGSDIRKPNAWAMESLGKVMSLKKEVINGYKTMNSVLVEPGNTRILLLAHRTYSTGEPDFVTQETIGNRAKELEQLQETASKEDSNADIPNWKRIELEAQASQIKRGDYINNSKAYLDNVHQSHHTIRLANPTATITHIQDREMDSHTYFEAVDDLGDKFVTRVQLSRLSNEVEPTYTKNGNRSKKLKYKKLITKDFQKKSVYKIPQLTLKGKNYIHVTCQLEWEALVLNERTYRVLKITLIDARGQPLFQHSMLLITNHVIETAEDAKAVYHMYLLRFKIEIVFRFLKTNLGWETFQVRDFESIKNLLALVFFLAGYFKELNQTIQEHETFQFIALLGGGKGIISVTFILRGIQKLIHFQQVQDLIRQGSLSQQDIDDALKNVALL